MSTQQQAITELRLACESMAGALDQTTPGQGGILGLVSAFIPSVVKAFGFVSDLDKLPSYEGVGHEHVEFLGKVLKHSYAETRYLRAYRPAGLQTPLIHYLPQLEKSVDHVLDFVPNVLVPYITYLALLVSSRDAAMSTDDHKQLTGPLAAQRAELELTIGKMFDANTQKTDSTVAQLIERNADWPEIFKLSTSIDNKIHSLKIKDIDNKIRQAQDYLNIIYDMAQQADGKLKGATPEVLTALYEGAFQVACELEFVSVTYYRCLVVAQAIKDTKESLSKALS